MFSSSLSLFFGFHVQNKANKAKNKAAILATNVDADMKTSVHFANCVQVYATEFKVTVE